MTAQPHAPRRTPEEIRASIKDDRSPKALRAALPLEDHALFDRQYREALDQAKVSYDLAPVQQFQERWWATAVLKADPEDYRHLLARAEEVQAAADRGESLPKGRPWREVLAERADELGVKIDL